MADDLREALSKAFDESVAGDQSAPEPAPAEAPAPATEATEPAVLETPSANDASRERDEKGRFTKRSDEPAAPTKAPEVGQQAIVAQPQLQKALDPNAQAAPKPSAPPPGWSVQAKAEFDKLSPAVREAIARREEEVNNGFQKMQAYKGLEPYAEIAKNAGVTLDSAVEKWMAAEHKLANSFDDAIADLCGYFQKNPLQVAQTLFQRFTQGQQGYQQPYNPAAEEMRFVRTELEALKAERQREADDAINGEVQAFMADPANKYFENVKPRIIELLKTGACRDLKHAYSLACNDNPEIMELLINERSQTKQAEAQRKASEARRAAGSLSPGSPLPNGTTGGSKGKSVRDDLLEAYNAHTI